MNTNCICTSYEACMSAINSEPMSQFRNAPAYAIPVTSRATSSSTWPFSTSSMRLVATQGLAIPCFYVLPEFENLVVRSLLTYHSPFRIVPRDPRSIADEDTCFRSPVLEFKTREPRRDIHHCAKS